MLKPLCSSTHGSLLPAGKLLHRCKGPHGDPVTRLQDQPWTTCAQWLSSGQYKDCFVCGTGQHKLRLYDTRAQKRPLFETGWRDAKITSLAADDAAVWAANTKGCIQVRSTFSL
jgi:hypothetical protein